MKFIIITGLLFVSIALCTEQVYTSPEIKYSPVDLNRYDSALDINFNNRISLLNQDAQLTSLRRLFLDKKDQLRADVIRSFSPKTGKQLDIYIIIVISWLEHLEKQDFNLISKYQFKEDLYDLKSISKQLQNFIIEKSNSVNGKLALIDVKQKQLHLLEKEIFIRQFNHNENIKEESVQSKKKIEEIVDNVATVNTEFDTAIHGICSVVNKIEMLLQDYSNEKDDNIIQQVHQEKDIRDIPDITAEIKLGHILVEEEKSTTTEEINLNDSLVSSEKEEKPMTTGEKKVDNILVSSEKEEKPITAGEKKYDNILVSSEKEEKPMTTGEKKYDNILVSSEKEEKPMTTREMLIKEHLEKKSEHQLKDKKFKKRHKKNHKMENPAPSKEEIKLEEKKDEKSKKEEKQKEDKTQEKSSSPGKDDKKPSEKKEEKSKKEEKKIEDTKIEKEKSISPSKEDKKDENSSKRDKPKEKKKIDEISTPGKDDKKPSENQSNNSSSPDKDDKKLSEKKKKKSHKKEKKKEKKEEKNQKKRGKKKKKKEGKKKVTSSSPSKEDKKPSEKKVEKSSKKEEIKEESSSPGKEDKKPSEKKVEKGSKKEKIKEDTKKTDNIKITQTPKEDTKKTDNIKITQTPTSKIDKKPEGIRKIPEKIAPPSKKEEKSGNFPEIVMLQVHETKIAQPSLEILKKIICPEIHNIMTDEVTRTLNFQEGGSTVMTTIINEESQAIKKPAEEIQEFIQDFIGKTIYKTSNKIAKNAAKFILERAESKKENLSEAVEETMENISSIIRQFTENEEKSMVKDIQDIQSSESLKASIEAVVADSLAMVKDKKNAKRIAENLRKTLKTKDLEEKKMKIE